MRLKAAKLALVVLGIFSAGVAASQEDPIATRQELMKELGPHLRTVFEMVRGDREFDFVVAEEAMNKVVEHGAVLPTLFPEGSHVGSNASELIWEEFDDFVAIYADLEAAGQVGVEAAAAADAEGVQAALTTVGDACGRCHERYRIR